MSYAAATAAAILVVIGLAGWFSGGNMAQESKSGYAGDWVRVDGAPCVEAYPSSLLLRLDGTYLAPGAVEAGAIWHGGDWGAVSEEGAIRIQAANDAMLTYKVVISADGLLTLEAADGCKIRYARVEHAGGVE